MRCILQFQGSHSVNQANSLLNSSLELFQHELELKYAMLRYLVWLIPTLGFIGTVVGIAFALDYAANIEDPQDPTLLAEITGSAGRRVLHDPARVSPIGTAGVCAAHCTEPGGDGLEPIRPILFGQLNQPALRKVKCGRDACAAGITQR